MWHVKTRFIGCHENKCLTKEIALFKYCCFLLDYFLIRWAAKLVVDIALYEKFVPNGCQLLFILIQLNLVFSSLYFFFLSPSELAEIRFFLFLKMLYYKFWTWWISWIKQVHNLCDSVKEKHFISFFVQLQHQKSKGCCFIYAG